MTKEHAEYFSLAKSWADDMYAAVIASRNRYKIAFYLLIGMAFFLTAAITLLIPLQHVELVVVHHYNDGTVWVQPGKQNVIVHNKNLVESEIVRYVIERESYSASSYDQKYSLVTLLSSAKVAKQYAAQQSISNELSPVNYFGKHGYRKTLIENVLFLAEESFGKKSINKTGHANLAQVNFRVVEKDLTTGQEKNTPFVALISWEYRGTPQNPKDMWRNWDGFTVINYEVEQRSI